MTFRQYEDAPAPTGPCIDLRRDTLPDGFTEELASALAVVAGLKSFARAEAFERRGLGKYEPTNPLIVELVRRKLIKVNRVGSIAMTERTYAVYRILPSRITSRAF